MSEMLTKIENRRIDISTNEEMTLVKNRNKEIFIWARKGLKQYKIYNSRTDDWGGERLEDE